MIRAENRPSTSIPQRHRSVAALCVLALSTLAAPAVQACTDASPRELTAEERAHYGRVAEQLKATLPAAPRDMWLVKEPKIGVPNRSCSDIKVATMSVNVTAVYRYRMPAAERATVQTRRTELEARYNSMRELPPGLKAEYDAWVARYHEAIGAAKRLEREGKDAAAAPKYDEANNADRQSKEVWLRHQKDMKPQLDALKLEMDLLPEPEADFEVVVGANGFHTAPYGNEAVLTYGIDDHAAFRPYRVEGLRVRVAGGRIVTDPKTFKQTMGSNAAQRDALLAAFDRARLQALMKHPLPDTFAPAAWQVGAPPQERGTPPSAPVPVADRPQPGPAPATATPPAARSGEQPDGAAQQGAETQSVGETADKAVEGVEKAAETAERAKEAARKLRGLFKF
jgi:hypothetical protein